MHSTIVLLVVVAMAGLVAPAAVVPAPERNNIVPGGITACAICKYVIAVMDTIEHNSEEKIEADLDALCLVVPVPTVRTQCVTKINTWVQQVINEYNQHNTQEDVCKKLLMCK